MADVLDAFTLVLILLSVLPVWVNPTSLQGTCICSSNTETRTATTAGYLRLDLLCSILCHDVARTRKIIF